MLKNGTYVAYYATPLNQGAGVAHIEDGKLTGSDSIMNYDGTYEVDGNRFAGILRTTRHSEGHETVFGVDNLTLRIEGICIGKVASYVATADEVPGMVLEGTLIRSEEVSSEPKPSRPLPPFDPERLPKPLRSR
jgi:hypothetical protein